MMKIIRPDFWLPEQYEHPYYVVYTYTSGEIVYEDQYRIAAKAVPFLRFETPQPSWTRDNE